MAKAKKEAKKEVKIPAKKIVPAKKEPVPAKKVAPAKKQPAPVKKVEEKVVAPLPHVVQEEVTVSPVEFDELVIKEIMVQKGISRDEAIDILRNPSK